MHCVALCCTVLQRFIQPTHYCHAIENAMQCVAVCYGVLQCVAAFAAIYSAYSLLPRLLECVAVWCIVLQCVTVCRSVLQCVASVLQQFRSLPIIATPLRMCFIVLHCFVVCCSVLQVCCSNLGSLLIDATPQLCQRLPDQIQFRI